MESRLVLRAPHLPDSRYAQHIAAGAIPAEIALGTWQALQRLKDLAQLLPPYAAGTDLKTQALALSLPSGEGHA